MTIEAYLKDGVQHIDAVLSELLPEPSIRISQLNSAMRYSLLAGGKRIRPLLVYAVAEAYDVDKARCDIPAAAMEMIHTFSLIHDDLPAMDDDVLRRGKPTCHIAFDEATAILAGDALHTEAFDLLTQSDFKPETICKMVQTLSRAIGQSGMVQGQAIDVESSGKQLPLDQLKQMHYLKTGCLIEASVILGYYCAEQPDPDQEFALRQYAQSIGLAFQVQDDILDATANTEALGKTAGIDADNDKCNFVALLGLKTSQKHARDLIDQATQALKPFPHLLNSPLQAIAEYIIARKL